MKKVAFLVLHLGYGGVERAVISEANLLCDCCDVEIICFYKLYDKPAFDINPKIKITYLTENLVPNRAELKSAIQNKNIASLFREGFKSIKILYLRSALMKKAIKNLDADIIISSRYLYHKLLTNNAKKGTVLIAQEHNHHNGDKKYIKKQINAVRNMDYFMPVSRELTDFYKDRVVGKVKCHYIPHHLEYIPKSLSQLTEKNIISVGRLSPEKGMDDLIRVFALVYKKHPDWKLHIAGDGECHSEIEELIKQLGLEQNVILHGFKNREELNRMLSTSSVYVMASHTESFGLVLIEAQSFGLPCVAFDSARGACEILSNNKNGFLINNRSLSDMANAIDKLITDFDYRTKLGKAGRQNAEKYFLPNVKEQWIKLINNI